MNNDELTDKAIDNQSHQAVADAMVRETTERINTENQAKDINVELETSARHNIGVGDYANDSSSSRFAWLYLWIWNGVVKRHGKNRVIYLLMVASAIILLVWLLRVLLP